MIILSIVLAIIGLGEASPEARTAGAGRPQFASEVRSAVEAKVREVLLDKRYEASPDGVVTHVGDGRFFLQHDAKATKIVCTSCKPPAVGDSVVVRGYPTLEGGRVVLFARSWTADGTKPLPPPVRVTGEDLTDAGDYGINGRRIVLEGRAIDATERGFALDVDNIPVSVILAKLPKFLNECAAYRPRVRVTGTVELILDQSVLFGEPPFVMGIKLYVNDGADITLLPDASYLARIHKDNLAIVIYLVVSLLVFAIFIVIYFLVRQYRRAFKTATLMAERKRMADDIHDTIEQHLVGAGMFLQLNRTKEAREILLRAKSELRDIIWGLKNDDMMRLTPKEMLEKTAEVETQKGLFRVTSRIQGLPETMTAAEKRDLSLIVREAIGNAVKHGSAKKIAITCDAVNGGGWMLRIANDGKPFDPESAPGAAEGHFGLSGMRERAKRLGAEVDIYRKNAWTVVKVEVKP